MHNNYFDFERLDVYRLAVTVNRAVATTHWPVGRSHLKDQAIRAADSMVLNIAEGAERGRGTKAAKSHRAAFGFRIAKGSAGEVFATLDILDLDTDSRGKLQRIGSMLSRLSR